jgi:glycosyltransferase involved in cell wall biosynthesis
LNVLVDATALASGHRWRGIGSYVRHLVDGLLQQVPDGARFLTLTNDGDGIPPGKRLAIRSRVPPRWDDLWALYGRSVHRAVAQSGSSLYHFTSAEASLRGNGVKTVATVYDLIPVELPHSSMDPRDVWRRAVYRLYLRRLRAADHIIAISASTADAVLRLLGIPAERTTVIPLGIEQADYVARAQRTRAAIATTYHLPDVYWLTVTAPNPNKGWRDLVDALLRARQRGTAVPLVIAGHWLPPHRRQLLEQADRLGVASLVQFLGFVPDDDLPALYAQARGFIFPSHREGFGLPVLEAMAVGTPVIISDDPALRELVDGAGLSFPRGDASALAERMVALAAQDDERRRLGRLASERAARFTWERTVTETVAVYRAVAAN